MLPHPVSVSSRVTVQKSLLIVWVATALAGLGIAATVLGPVVGIKSGYVFIGFLMSSYVYYSTSLGHLSWSGSTATRAPGKTVFLIGMLSILAIPITERLSFADAAIATTVILLVGLPTGYVLLAIQIRRRAPPRWLLAQIVVLFLVSPIIKYQATRFYIGKGDTPTHVYWIDQIVASGTWEIIPESAFYYYFPGHQTLLGLIRVLAGFSSYDSYMYMGIITYAVVICVGYLLATAIFEERIIGCFVALGVSLLVPVLTAGSYFYPQSLATAIVFILLLIALKNATEPSRSASYTFLGLMLVGMLWFTHHLTVVLFTPIVLALLVLPVISDRIKGRFVGTIERSKRPQALLLVVWIGGSILYWEYQNTFTEPLIRSVREILAGTVIAGQAGEGGVSLRTLGTASPDPSTEIAAISLVSPDGIYNMALVGIVALGIVTIVGSFRRYAKGDSFLVVGAIGTILLLPTPLVAVGIQRLQLPLSMFVALVVGIGLARLFLATDSSRTTIASVFVVFLLFSTAAPVVSADHHYPLHNGPDLWEVQPLPEYQKEFNEQEMQSLARVSTFIDQQQIAVGTDWHSQIGLQRFGVDSNGMTIRNDQIRTNSRLLLYRQRWSDHSLRIIPERLNQETALISEEWREDLVHSENKVYTTNEIGLLAARNQTQTDERRVIFSPSQSDI